jgi:hypothetical protein
MGQEEEVNKYPRSATTRSFVHIRYYISVLPCSRRHNLTNELSSLIKDVHYSGGPSGGDELGGVVPIEQDGITTMKTRIYSEKKIQPCLLGNESHMKPVQNEVVS